ncbi:MAG: protein translocase subunit SecF [Deltaproteobacteria bacterium]|nr:protein translocase subunit SecF [Deltaproteobacteria bacterium]
MNGNQFRFRELVRPGTRFDFMKNKWVFAAISGGLFFASLISFAVKGMNYGIDFAGGIETQVQFKSRVEPGELRATLEKGGLKNLSVQQFGSAEHHEFLLRAKGGETDLYQFSSNITERLNDKFGEGNFEIRRVDIVGPQVGNELKKAGFLAILYAFIGILLYTAIRFDFTYAPGAVIALVHDVTITAGIFSMTGREFNLPVVAALLTIIGYSINDTIVVFDRIREIRRHKPIDPLHAVINEAMNETLSRTILTSLTVLMVVVILFFYGGATIEDFSFALVIGVIVGSYSTIGIASPMMYGFHLLRTRKLKKV